MCWPGLPSWPRPDARPQPLTDYISPFGSGYFLALPGVADGSDYLAVPCSPKGLV